MDTSTPALPVVAVHGIRLSRTMWGPVVDRLADRHPTTAVDLPGHGRRRGEPFTIDGAAEAVADGIDAVGGRALVLGLSLGGYVGIAAAARYPRRVAGLLVIGCTALPRGPFGVAYRAAARAAARHPAAARWASIRGLGRMLPAPAAEAALAGGVSCEVLPDVVAGVAGMDPLGGLAAYPGPVWLVNGERDPFRRDERRFLRACRDGRLSLLPGHGHLTPLGSPRMLARLVADACAAVPAAAT